MNPKITVRKAYQQALMDLHSICDTPGLDAQMLLANAMDRSRAWILSHPEVELNNREEKYFFQSLLRASNGEPLPYVLGWWEFFGRKFKINNSVLVPRPETEHLVETAIGHLQSRSGGCRALDVGTGSGCIAISLSLEVNDLHAVATDISWAALEVARTNAIEYGVDARIQFLQMDLTSGLKGVFDIVCANLPYIPTAILHRLDVSRKEPRLALDGGRDGFKLIRPMLIRIPDLLIPGGCALFELEAGTGEIVLQMAKAYLHGARFELLQDLAGHNRVLVVQT